MSKKKERTRNSFDDKPVAQNLIKGYINKDLNNDKEPFGLLKRE